ncbi:OadG family protein [Confluentibacter lentus]|uniref:OadG family protein n=1 Tax=Confluentibacter lentus TaxID=1699412 RepID=UPI000C2891B6|nr:OadG family protein [Confluentibacter lentus]
MIRVLLYTDTLVEGYIILITGLLIVFGGLILLTVFFKYGLPIMLYIYKIITRGRDKKVKDISPKVNQDFTGEIAAAISVAIHLYLDEQHDEENAILTIKQARKLYSPWSSKIYSAYRNRL